MFDVLKKDLLLDKVIKNSHIRAFSLIVKGKSMWPFMRDGAEVKCTKIYEGEKRSIGEVVVIKKRIGVLVHRIISFRKCDSGRQYLVKGDWRLVSDGWIPADKIVAIASNTSKCWKVQGVIVAGYSLITLLVGKLFRRKNLSKMLK